MSTKIYDAYKLAQPYTLYQLNQKLDELRVEIQKIGIRSIREKAIELTLYVYNYKCACGTEAVDEMIEKTDMRKHPEIKSCVLAWDQIWEEAKNEQWKAVYHDCRLRIIDKIKEVSKSSFKFDYDYRCNLQIIPMKRKTLVLYFGNLEMQQYLESLPDFLTDYHYQDQTDKPDDISTYKWKQREKDWENAIGPDYIPCLHGFRAELFDIEYIMPVCTPSKIDDVKFPTVNDQISAVRKALPSIKNVDGYSEDHSVSERIAFTHSEPYIKWFNDANKMISEKCNFITNMDEFMELMKN